MVAKKRIQWSEGDGVELKRLWLWLWLLLLLLLLLLWLSLLFLFLFFCHDFLLPSFSLSQNSKNTFLPKLNFLICSHFSVRLVWKGGLLSCWCDWSFIRMPFWWTDQVFTQWDLFPCFSLGPGWSLKMSSSKIPSALSRQRAMIQSKFPPAAAREDDVQSVVSEAASVSSWTQVPQGQGHGQSSTESPDPWAETGEQTDSDGLKMPPADLKLGSIPEHGTADQAGRSHAAPVTQAAQNWVDHANETPAQRRLRKEQEKAARKGYRRVQWKQMGAHNAVNVALPKHIQQVGSGEGERSVLVLDARDLRMQSPYQGWLLDEIITNAYAGINVLSDRQLVRAPSSGYHLNIFMLKTLVGHKLVLCGSMTSYGGVPCGAWDAPTGSVLSHQAFQPFRWPLMSEESPTWVDVKVKLGGHLLVHLELRGYRSDQDMSVQLHHVAEALLWLLQEEIFVPTFVVTIFQGYRVLACSWEVGGRLYAVSRGGVVVALDYPLCHFELRLVTTSCKDAFGMDADRLEFRFLSAADRLDVACSVCSVPPSWLVVSRVSGPTLVRNAAWCRDHYARIESPDQALQLSQLAGIHAHWTAATSADREEDTGPRISAVAVESHPSNVHLIAESPLFHKEKCLVEAEALALQQHDPMKEKAAAVVPPILDGPAVQPTGVASAHLKSLTSGSADQSGVPSNHRWMHQVRHQLQVLGWEGHWPRQGDLLNNVVGTPLTSRRWPQRALWRRSTKLKLLRSTRSWKRSGSSTSSLLEDLWMAQSSNLAQGRSLLDPKLHEVLLEVSSWSAGMPADRNWSGTMTDRSVRLIRSRKR